MSNKLYIFPILLFISLLAFVYFTFPEYQNYKGLKKDIANKKIKIEKKQLYIARLKSLSSKVDIRKSSINKIETALPPVVNYAFLINFLGKKADENGLLLKSFDKEQAPSSKDKKKNADENKNKKKEIKAKKNYFSVTLSGTMDSFENFVSSLEKSSRLFEVENITVKKGEKGFLDFSVVFSVYSYKLTN